MPLTNNKMAYELLNNKIIYDENIEELLKKGLDFENNTSVEDNKIY